MTEIPTGRDSEGKNLETPSADAGESATNGSQPTILEMAVYVPVGLAALAREALEKLISEGAARGEVEVNRARTALENEVEIARSVGRARVRGALKRSAARFEYPPLSLVAQIVSGLGERGKEALQELQTVIGIRRSEEELETSGDGADLGRDKAEESARGVGLANLRSAQRTAAARVLKARFRKESPGEDGEVVKVTFVEDEAESESEKLSSSSPSELSPPSSLEDYDSLSASQVVARLGGLSREELEALLEYENATKSRAAVIERIHQEIASRDSS